MLHVKLPNCPLGPLSWGSAVRLPTVVARTGQLPQINGRCMLEQPSLPVAQTCPKRERSQRSLKQGPFFAIFILKAKVLHCL